MFKRIFASAIIFGMAAIAPPAHAQACTPRDTLIGDLSDRYAETQLATGLQGNGVLLEIWASPAQGT